MAGTRSTAGKPKRRAPRKGASRTRVARSPGRPAAGADQAQRILDAALACYAREGVKATSIRDVAREAGVTPALVHYYYGDAERLLEEVINARVLPVFGAVRDAVTRVDEEDPGALATGFVNAICQAIELHPWLPPLWVREIISEGGALRDLLVTRIGPLLPQAIARAFARAQQQGRVNPDLDPRLIVVTLIGLTLLPAAGAPVWRRIFNARDLDMDGVRRHALALLARGLEAA